MRKVCTTAVLLACAWHATAFAQCAPAPDSPYFFRNLSEQRAEAKIAADPAVYEKLLSDTFLGRGDGGKQLSKRDFIGAELATKPAKPARRFYAISNYTLLEHRKGYTVASYLLTEGMIGPGETHVVESQMREVYEVIDGEWRLASVEAAPVPAPTHDEP
jgi:hypothetical protein